MFRNPVYDLIIVVPALLIAALLGFLVMTSAARAAETDLPATTATSTPGGRAIIASTSGNTLPDLNQKVIVVTQAEAKVNDAWDTAAITALSVRSAGELEAYARQTLREDPYIESITLSGRGIVVAYQKNGRLLGLVPVAVPTKAVVRTDGNVSFSEPWYGAVTLAERDHMKTALEVRVHALLTSEGYLASMQLAPVTQAEILDIIRELVG
ncbi:MAG: hypothetical protein ACM3TU_02865 [Bacillota bacterium]